LELLVILKKLQKLMYFFLILFLNISKFVRVIEFNKWVAEKRYSLEQSDGGYSRKKQC